MSKAPTKNDTIQFKPREFTTPNKDHQGITRTVFTHVSTLHGLVTDWLKIKEKGIRLCKAISALKLHECEDDYYPSHLKSLMEGLLELLDALKNIIESVQEVDSQLASLAKLQPTAEPVISTWSVTQISKTVSEGLQSLEKEYNLKQVVTDNVAHCREEKLIEVYTSAWEFEVYFDMQCFAYLFAEAGLAGIT